MQVGKKGWMVGSVTLFLSLLMLPAPILSETSVAVTAGSAGALPSAKDPKALPLFISSTNAVELKSLLLPELLDLIQRGNLVVEALDGLRSDFRYEQTMLVQQRSEPSLFTSTGGLRSDLVWPRGFLCGGEREIEAENDPNVRGAKILANIDSFYWSQESFSAGMKIRVLQQAEVSREIVGSLVRIFPHALFPGDKSIQLWRELFRVQAPRALKNFSYLTYRFLENNEDLLWTYSPAIQKTRQLTGSNRSDVLIGLGFSLDDFLLWSGNLSWVSAKAERAVTTLAPFVDWRNSQARMSADGCLKFVQTQTLQGVNSALSNWNQDGRRFETAAPWTPVGVLFVPRKTWPVELLQRDPYSSIGRQILYVDAGTLLPVYKVVYDRTGKPLRFVLMVYGLATIEGKKYGLPYPSRMLSVELKSLQATMVDYTDVEYCSSGPAGMKLTDFEPAQLAPTPASGK